MIDLEGFYNIYTLLVNKMFKFTINNERVDPMFAHHLIRMALNEKSIVGRAKNTHFDARMEVKGFDKILKDVSRN